MKKAIIGLAVLLSTISTLGVTASAYQWPTTSTRITQSFSSNGHLGVDIGATLSGHAGDSIYAFDYGNVIRNAYSTTYGNCYYINHQNPKSSGPYRYLQTRYAHLNDRYYNSLGTVYQGTFLGTMGNSGQSFGVHLHFETRMSDSIPTTDNASSFPVNPIGNYFNNDGVTARSSSGTINIPIEYDINNVEIDNYSAPKTGIQ